MHLLFKSYLSVILNHPRDPLTDIDLLIHVTQKRWLANLGCAFGTVNLQPQTNQDQGPLGQNLLAVLKLTPGLNGFAGTVALVDTRGGCKVAPTPYASQLDVVLEIESQVAKKLDRFLYFLFPKTHSVHQREEG